MDMELGLQLVSGVAWTVVYVVCIVIGFRDKTYAMPVFALALNFAWEVINSWHGLSGAEGFSAQVVVNCVWAACDLVMIVTFLRFGKARLPKLASDRFGLFAVMVFATGAVAQLAFFVHFDHLPAAQYSAFAQNALMSVLFIAMFVYRRGPAGQSMVIAVAKWLGTLAPTLQHGLLYGVNEYVLLMGLICFVWDIVYIILLAGTRTDRRA
mgnify:CR=1 FL=1